MANLLETSEIKRETVDNLISDQKSRDVIQRNRNFIMECPDCKKKFHRRILFLQHRELLHSENKKKQKKRRLSDGLTNNAAFNCEKDAEKLNCNNDITVKEEVVGTEPRKEIKIEVKDEFECSEYTLTPFTHYEVHIKKDSVKEDESKRNDKSAHKQRKRHQDKDNALRPFQCEICDRTFARKDTLTIHLRIHTGEKPFECQICNKTFRQKRRLTEHLPSHIDVKLFQCKICSLLFKTKFVLVKHCTIQHPENNPYEGIETFDCDACQKKFLYKTNFFTHKRIHTRQKHLESHTGRDDFIDDSEHSSFTCEICSKTFMRKGKLTEHLRSHTNDRPFQCKICSSRYKTKLVLVKHSITQHPENNPYEGIETFECDACQKKFLYKSDLLNHKRIHTKEKPFNCAVCQKGYWKKPQLVQHLNSHTGNEKDFVDNCEYPPFACEVCNKTFKQKGKLTRHLRSHTDDRPFQCKICSLRFKTKPVLIKHSYRQHPEDNPYDCKKDYRCEVCQKKFLYQSDMVYHRKKHTGDKPFSCNVCKKGFWKKPYFLKHLESHSGKESEKDENLVFERCSEVVYMKDFTDFENHDRTYAWIKEEKNENVIEPCSKVVFIKEKLNYNNDLQHNEEVILYTEHEKKASLRCKAQAKEEMKIEVKDELECGEYTLQPLMYHGLHIENNGVEEYESKREDHQVKEDVTDSENRNHGYTHEKQEEDNFTETCPDVVDIKEDADLC